MEAVRRCTWRQLVLGHVVCVFGDRFELPLVEVKVCDVDDEWTREWECHRTVNVRDLWLTGRAACIECGDGGAENRIAGRTRISQLCRACSRLCAAMKARNPAGNLRRSVQLILVGCAAVGCSLQKGNNS